MLTGETIDIKRNDWKLEMIERKIGLVARFAYVFVKWVDVVENQLESPQHLSEHHDCLKKAPPASSFRVRDGLFLQRQSLLKFRLDVYYRADINGYLLVHKHMEDGEYQSAIQQWGRRQNISSLPFYNAFGTETLYSLKDMQRLCPDIDSRIGLQMSVKSVVEQQYDLRLPLSFDDLEQLTNPIWAHMQGYTAWNYLHSVANLGDLDDLMLLIMQYVAAPNSTTPLPVYYHGMTTSLVEYRSHYGTPSVVPRYNPRVVTNDRFAVILKRPVTEDVRPLRDSTDTTVMSPAPVPSLNRHTWIARVAVPSPDFKPSSYATSLHAQLQPADAAVMRKPLRKTVKATSKSLPALAPASRTRRKHAK